MTRLSYSAPLETRNRRSPDLLSNLRIFHGDCAAPDASGSEDRFEVGIRWIAQSFTQMMSLGCSINLSLCEQLHVFSYRLDKAILAIDFLGIIHVQSTWMHIKDHIRKTKFFSVDDE
jgi:hypothetical protein